jgi:hypothetical protein
MVFKGPRIDAKDAMPRVGILPTAKTAGSRTVPKNRGTPIFSASTARSSLAEGSVIWKNAIPCIMGRVPSKT